MELSLARDLWLHCHVSSTRLLQNQIGFPHRPNGPTEPSPGLRPKADALGGKASEQSPRPERPREFLPQSAQLEEQALAAFQAAGLRGVLTLLTQGIGLRPQMPWAKFSRPVGPGGPTLASASIDPPVRSVFRSKKAFFWMSLLVRSSGIGESRPRTPWHRPLE